MTEADEIIYVPISGEENLPLDWSIIEQAFVAAENARLADAQKIAEQERQGFTTEGLNLMGPSEYFFRNTVGTWEPYKKDPIVIEMYDRLHAYRAEDWLASPEMMKPVKQFVSQEEIDSKYHGKLTKEDIFSPADIFLPMKLDFSSKADFDIFLHGLPYDRMDYDNDAARIKMENLEYKIKQHPPLSLEHYIQMYNSASEYERENRFPALYQLLQGLPNEDGVSFPEGLDFLAGGTPVTNRPALQAIIQAYVDDSWGYLRFYNANTVNIDIHNSMSLLRQEEYNSETKTTFNIRAIMVGLDLAHERSGEGNLVIENERDPRHPLSVDMESYLLNDMILVRKTLQNWPEQDILDLDDSASENTVHADYNYRTFTRGIRDADNRIIQDGLMQYLTAYNNASEDERKSLFPNLYLLESALRGDDVESGLKDLEKRNVNLYNHLKSIIEHKDLLHTISDSNPTINRDVLSYISQSFIEQEYYSYLPVSLAKQQDFLMLKTQDEVNVAVTNQLAGIGLQEANLDEDVLPVINGDNAQLVQQGQSTNKVKLTKVGRYAF